MTKPEFIYTFDENRRVYRKAEPGKYCGAPIWIEHWRKQAVVGETRVSWILDSGTKIPKKPSSTCATSPCYSFREVQQREWAQANRHKIAASAQYCGYGCPSPESLSSVAKVLGLPEMPEFTGDDHG